VGRAEELVAGLREFSREGETSEGRVDLAASFEKVHRLMRQQFVSRQIDLGWDGADNVPQIPQSRHLVERIIVQAMAYARDTLQSMQTWHEEKAAPYKKTLEINWANVEGHCVMQFLWDSGNVPAGAFLIDPMSRTGLMLAQTLLAAEGGALEITESSLKITFPAEDNPQ
jgi:C4-dicarboxylate-specific signal transduction histidine kinase